MAAGILGAALSDANAYRNTYLMFAGVALIALAIAATLRPANKELRAAGPE